MTLAEINPLAELEDGSFVALDAHMEMENEAMAAPEEVLAEPRHRRRGGHARGPRARRAFEAPSRRSTPPTTAA